jgi:hypothetical protein
MLVAELVALLAAAVTVAVHILELPQLVEAMVVA